MQKEKEAVEGRAASCHVHSEQCSYKYDPLFAAMTLHRFAICLLGIAVRIGCRCARR